MTDETKMRRLRAEPESALANCIGCGHGLEFNPNAEYRNEIHSLGVYRTELELQNEELRRAHLELEAARDRYADLYDFAPIGYFSLSETGRIIDVNLAGAALLATSRSELVGRTLTTFVIVQDVKMLRNHITDVLTTGTRQVCEIGMVRTDGSHLSARLESIAVPAVGGVDRHLRTALTDVTESRCAAEALQAATIHAEQANAAKSRFLAAASHDLRQPVQALALLLGVLATKVQGEAARTALAQCDVTLCEMMEMLDTLLDINQLESGSIQPVIVGFPIARLSERLTRQFASDIVARNLEWRVVPSRLSVLSDARLLEQILRNLVSNAIKYTKYGRVLLGCRRRGDTLRIEIGDTGIGIPEDRMQEIFEEFHQIDNAARQRSKGFGLGLSIVRKLATLLGHAVEVRSRLGRGSLFTIVVPIAREQPPPISNGHDRVATDGRHRNTILVIEDDPLVREALVLVLHKEGYRTLAAGDGDTALAVARCAANRPDIVVTDFNLPKGMNGLETVADLRKLVCNPRLPAIVLTGDIAVATSGKMSDQGCEYLRKPTSLVGLIQCIGRMLEQAARQRNAAHSANATG